MKNKGGAGEAEKRGKIKREKGREVRVCLPGNSGGSKMKKK